ncbi:thymidylate synthase [Candidatus Parcubacteria bacterium]|nr:MAG: thymidylate synthase [Candidatus Parcubacteria bacterium]
MIVEYKRLEHRPKAMQYSQLLRRIVDFGEDIDPQQEHPARMIVGHQWRFRLDDGFPIVTERDLCSPTKEGRKTLFHMALGELFAFLHGARTQEELVRWGAPWWKKWVTPEKCEKRGLQPGDLGPGSYGAAWRAFPTAEGEPFDQITSIIQQIKEKPHLRTHFISPWIPQYTIRIKGRQQKVVVCPCHGWVHIFINPRTNEMKLHHFQRSGDVPVGVAANLIQYAALTMMMAQVTGYKPVELVYTISDAHIYLGQMKDVQDMLDTDPQPFPTVELDSTITDILDFRQEHFKVSDYKPQLEARVIWTPV